MTGPQRLALLTPRPACHSTDKKKENLISTDDLEAFLRDDSDAVRSAPKHWWQGDAMTFKFICKEYKPEYNYFELIEFMRKFALVGMLPLLGGGSPLQVCQARPCDPSLQ